MDKLVSLCKRRGFIFQSSEIYGGLGSTWDYGPLGVELKRNVKEAWWKSVVYEREDMEGLDASILMHPDVWKASGHVGNFADTVFECRKCNRRMRPEDLKNPKDPRCPHCGAADFTPPKSFNLMFKTFVGPSEDDASLVYLRPETAQGIFVNFENVLVSSRQKLPFGIAQIGKAFRNEITTGHFTFRSREFEQMEIEYFVKPGTDEEWHRKWVQERYDWYIGLGIEKENLKLRPHAKDELAHYAKACTDIEYKFASGWSELEGIANRADFDLSQHSKLSGKELNYFDEDSKARLVPYVIEPSGGVDRAVLAFLVDSYKEEAVKGETRAVLALHKKLAPIKAAILPLLKKKPEIVSMAKKIAADLRPSYKVKYDDTASIGRLYRRQDEIGTPFCVTVDMDSLSDNAVTVRDRDTMKQDRISAEKLKEYLRDRL
ncbi:MAG: glycine--tRNA ligase [Candidatus Omnitrophota bacterium]